MGRINLKEENIKAVLIDFLLSQPQTTSSDVLFSELSFADKKRRADLVLISVDSMIAFEVKSAGDNLMKLHSQVEDYNSCFDYLYVVVDIKHSRLIKAMLPRSTGIYLFKDGEITLIREAIQRKRLNKSLLLSMLTKQELFKVFQDSGGIKGITNQMSKSLVLKKLSEKLSLEKVRGIVRKQLLAKYRHRYFEFLKERGEVTNLDDLSILTKDQGVELRE